jgi:hypothetical protein
MVFAPQQIPKKSQQIKTDKPRPHVCTICTRAFARLEHLKRHERSHTNEKPFQCAACGRCFARRDLVLRHQQKLHASLPNIMRRGSEPNEHIIVLTNNTNANAPLPKDDSTPNSTPTQIFLPSKDYKTLYGVDEDSEVSPPSNLTPPNMASKSDNLSPKKSIITKPHLFSDHLMQPSFSQSNSLPSSNSNMFNNFRHASFSAASGTSYTLGKDITSQSDVQPHDRLNSSKLSYSDDMNISKDLLLSGIDLNVDWNQMEGLDAAQKKKSIKNLQQYFVESVTNNNNVNFNNVLASFQFHNPNHPHHIKGTTPIDYTIDPLVDINMMKAFEQSSNDFEANGASRHVSNGNKKMKLNSNDDWLQELIETSADQFLDTATPGLIVPELKSQGSVDESAEDISNLFKTRQFDLSKQIDGNSWGRRFVSQELRTRIVSISNLTDSQFPSIDELNKYLDLYEIEFDKYFPFIHLPTLRNSENYDSIPLILSMSSIGALYSFNNKHTLLLFNLSKYHIQHFFEKEITLDNLQFKKVPHMAHQCLVLHIFISMFLNEPNMIDITQRQIKSMIGLINSTNFSGQLENFMTPPKSFENVQANYDYFVTAQSRIRTIRVFYMLQIIRSSFVGVPIFFNSKELRSGNPCADEDLWNCENAQQWYEKVRGLYQSITQLSNGESTQDLIKSLQPLSGSYNNKCLLGNLLTLLIYLHEQLSYEYDTVGDQYNYINWNLHHKPNQLDALQSWEHKFLNNGGILAINHNNKHLLNAKHDLKLILPLHSLFKIRAEINIRSFISPILFKQWDQMNIQLDKFVAKELNQENLKHCLPNSINIIKLWIFNIESINYDIKQTSLRTPVFFVLCIMVSMVILSLYLQYLEEKSEFLTDSDLLSWYECEAILLKVDRVLTPILKSSYSEVLTNQADGVFKSINQDHNVIKISGLLVQKEQIINDEIAMKQLNQEINKEIKHIKLSKKSLYLGIRILADAPVWPVATGFAEALKKRATYLSQPKNLS